MRVFAIATFAMLLSILAILSFAYAVLVFSIGLGGEDDLNTTGMAILAGILALPGVVLGAVALILWRALLAGRE